MHGTILVVVADTQLLNQIRRLFTKQGHEVVTVRDAYEAESAVSRARPDLVVVDADLPGTGAALVQRLKTSPETGSIPLILITPTPVVDERAAVADGYVGKPLRSAELASWTSALVQMRSLQVSVEQAEATLIAIAAAVEARSQYPPTHLRRVGDLSEQLAAARGLDEAARRAIRTAALLRDIGNIAVPDAILIKPGPLTPEEFALVKQHPVRGAELVRHLPSGEAISTIVRGHHEWWNGTGYPDGLKKEQIPLGARIVAIADAYAAHTADRPYRAALSPEDAREILWGGGESQWDPVLVETFMGLADAPAGTSRQFDSPGGAAYNHGHIRQPGADEDE